MTTIKYRVDAEAGLITSFNTENGERVSYASKADATFKPDTPMLVDMSITNYCYYGCQFCYRSSTESGSHASFDSIARALELCKGLGVFEVVLGGGDPVAHRDFMAVLLYGKRLGLTMSFTTRNSKWLLDNAFKLNGLVKAVGLSVSSAGGVNAFLKSPARLDLQAEVILHVIPEMLKRYDYELLLNMAKAHNLKLLLLGFKAVGRGHNYIPNPQYNPIETARDIYGDSFAIDTMLASTYRDSLQGQKYIRYDEGVDSLFIDATKETFSISSYSSEAWPLEYASVIEKFQGWGGR